MPTVIASTGTAASRSIDLGRMDNRVREVRNARRGCGRISLSPSGADTDWVTPSGKHESTNGVTQPQEALLPPGLRPGGHRPTRAVAQRLPSVTLSATWSDRRGDECDRTGRKESRAHRIRGLREPKRGRADRRRPLRHPRRVRHALPASRRRRLHLAGHLDRSEAESDDLVADAFTKVLDTLRAGKGPDSAFRAYLLTALRHAA